MTLNDCIKEQMKEEQFKLTEMLEIVKMEKEELSKKALAIKEALSGIMMNM